MAEMAYSSFPYYFSIPNSEFRIPNFVEQTERLIILILIIRSLPNETVGVGISGIKEDKALFEKWYFYTKGNINVGR